MVVEAEVVVELARSVEVFSRFVTSCDWYVDFEIFLLGPHWVDSQVIVLDIFLFAFLLLVFLVRLSTKGDRMLFCADSRGVRHDGFGVLLGGEMNEAGDLFGVVDDSDWNHCLFD